MWPWKANKVLIENLQIENSRLKDSLALIEAKQNVASLEEKAPRSITKDFKQTADGFLQECIGNQLIKSIPAGCYYYTKPVIVHENIIDLSGCFFYTNKDVPFMYIRGQNNIISGYPFIDVSNVKEPSGQAVIYLQHKSDHLIAGNFEFRIFGSQTQIQTTEGFNGIEFEGKTKYPTNYKNGSYEEGEAHRNNIKLVSMYLNKAVNIPNSGYSSAANFFTIIDQRSKMALNQIAGGRSTFHIEIESGTVLKENEIETPYIIIGNNRNRIWLNGEVGGERVYDGIKYFGHKIALENNGSENVLYEDSHLVAEGKIIQNKPLTLK